MAAFSSRGPVQNGRNKPDVVAPGTAILSTRSRTTQGTGWLASGDPLRFYDGGTSKATPLVAGCAAVVRQYLTTTGAMPNPSAALIKAMLINGATPIKGQDTPPEVGAIPDISEGFGRVDIPAIKASHTQLKVTLVWTDPAGETLQSDLDLTVSGSNGEERHGN